MSVQKPQDQNFFDDFQFFAIDFGVGTNFDNKFTSTPITDWIEFNENFKGIWYWSAFLYQKIWFRIGREKNKETNNQANQFLFSLKDEWKSE